ncbi:S1 family peptidase [Nesterenkonia populi]
MGRARISGIVTLGLLTASLNTAATENASPEEQSPSDQNGVALAATEYANDYGVSPEDAQSILDEQFDFSEFVASLGEAYPEDQFDAYISAPEEGGDFYIRTDNSSVQADIDRHSAESTYEIVLEQQEALKNTTHEDLDSAREALGSSLYGYYVDPQDGSLSLDVDADLLLADTNGQSEEDLEQLGPEGFAIPNDLDVTLTPHFDEPGDTDIYGGAATSSCTTGFTAQISGNFTHGFLTAAHGNCGSSLSVYSGTTQSSSLVGTSTPQATNHGANADISFHSMPTSLTQTSSFYGSGGTLTASAGPASVADGAYVCGRGMTEGVRCGNVQLGYAPTWDGACPGGSECNTSFARVDVVTDGGDSGGPWWVNDNQAIGIHKGGGANLSVFSLIEYAPGGSQVNY